MKVKSILAAALLAALLTGCYDSREIDAFANVTAVGIEPGRGKNSVPHRLPYPMPARLTPRATTARKAG